MRQQQQQHKRQVSTEVLAGEDAMLTSDFFILVLVPQLVLTVGKWNCSDGQPSRGIVYSS